MMNCTLIANEVIDFVKKKNEGGFLLKVDFKKAYDSVDWTFLQLVMRNIGFGERWRKWVMGCVSNAKVSVLVNGVATEPFKMSRGLRQGCPLSPFLFNIVAKAFSQMMDGGEIVGLCKGIPIGLRGLRISHLQFADDTMIFLKSEIESLVNAKRILRCFQAISGLRINFHKSSLAGIGTNENFVRECAERINYMFEVIPMVYLGLPLKANPNSIQTWKPIIEKFETRLAGWKAKTLSIGGRVALLRSVLSSLPIFYMSIFQIPKRVIKELEKIERRFLWCGSEKKQKIHYIEWSKVCNYKENGGLGIINMEVKNRALLNKWLWRYGSEMGSLWREVIVKKVGGNLINLIPEMSANKRVSTVWKNIIKPLSPTNDFSLQVSTDMQLVVGDGSRILFWADRWTDGGILKDLYPIIFALVRNKDGYIQEFGRWEEEVWVWEVQLRRPTFGWEEDQLTQLKECIEQYHLSRKLKDSLAWKGSRRLRGIYFCTVQRYGRSGQNGVKLGSMLGGLWNEVVFKGIAWDSNQTYEISKLRVATWAKAKWPMKYGEILDTYRFPQLGANLAKEENGRKVEGWCKPAQGEMKFNVDRAAKGSPREAGIGGAMRDEHGHVKIIFSKAIGIGDLNLAKIRAIREAFLLFIASKWNQSHSLIIESDSCNAVKWVNKPMEAP
ncbi:Uncharacterized protein TCM_022315 [Theobroma cacao]|uniref:Reverse transcriptase domain-containing protein n=1 Tax=Theobroma cacao TaxID=3641 RepID=A0A061EUA9_THECC|nr:Uncharacterized protein TCM_022315 [Theobroma cacao]